MYKNCKLPEYLPKYSPNLIKTGAGWTSCAVATRVWNGLDQSAGFKSSPVQADFDWTGSVIHQLSELWIGLDPEMCYVYPLFRDLRQFLLIVTFTSGVLPSSF